MKATIDVKDRNEGNAIRDGLQIPTMRAAVIIAGLLLPLSDRARKRVLDFVVDKLDEENQEELNEGERR